MYVCTCVSIIESNVLILMASHNDGQSRVTHHLVDLGVGCTVCTERRTLQLMHTNSIIST